MHVHVHVRVYVDLCKAPRWPSCMYPLGGPESELKKRYLQRPNIKFVIAMVLKF